MTTSDKTFKFKFIIDDSGAVTGLKSLQKGVKDVDLTSKAAKDSVDKLAASFKNIQGVKNINLTGQELGKLEKQIGGVSAATGSASASVLEMGRTISDSNYGIRGMANNLSQLASNMVYTAKAAGGFVAGLKQIWSAMLGPLGILLAIQGVLALWERYDMKQDEVKRGMKGLSTEIADQTKQVNGYISVLKNLNTTEEQRLVLLGQISSVSSEYADIVKKNKDNTDELIDSIKNYMQVQSLRAELEKLISEQNDRYARKEEALRILRHGTKQQMIDAIAEVEGAFKGLFSKQNWGIPLTDISLATEEEIREAFIEQVLNPLEKTTEYAEPRIQEIMNKVFGLGSTKEVIEGSLEYWQQKLKEAQEKQIKESTSPEIFKELGKVIDEIQAKIDAITGGKKPKGGRGKSLLKEQLFDLEKEIDSFNKREELALIRTNRQKLEIEQKYQLEALELKREEFVAKQELRLKDNEAQYALGKISQADFIKNQNMLIDSIRESDDELKTARKELREAQQSETDRFNEQEIDRAVESGLKLREASVRNMVAMYDEQKILRDEEAIRLQEERIAREELLAERLPQDSIERLEAEREISAMRMDLQTQELNHELMIIEAKKNAHMEYMSFVSGLGGILKNIAGENETLANVALALEKGSAIAGIIVQTQAANAKISAGAVTEQAGYLSAAAQTAASVGGGPQGITAAAPYYKLAAASAVAAKGRILKNNIASALSIAAILSTTLASRGGGTGGNGGADSSAPQGRTFDFNLVGSTGQNQLAQTIGGQVGQTIKAYVVGSEITNQQQFDNQIQGNATIGG